MKKLKIILHLILPCIFLLTYSISFGQDNVQIENESDNCLSCHMENDFLPEGFTLDDVHIKAGLTCAGCHGGDPSSDDEEEAMSEKNNFIGVPEIDEIPKFCGKCHSDIDFMRKYRPQIQTDQEAQYYTSLHGKQLLKGDDNVAQCSSCHTAHSIFRVKDPRSTVYPLNVPSTCNKCHGDSNLMNGYNIQSDQFEKYSQSVHGIALLENHDIGAPACNDCHGNHGAMPPAIKSISHVCGTCHVNNMNFFTKTRMAKEFDKLEYHSCEPCHGYHYIPKPSDEMIGVGPNSKCIKCHKPGENGYLAGKFIKAQLDSFVNVYDSATTAKVEVLVKGMNDAEIGFLLQEAKQKLIQTRTAVHTFDTVVVAGMAKEGKEIAGKALQLAESEMDEYYTRREGFIFTSIIFIILGVGLYLKIRNRYSTEKYS